MDHTSSKTSSQVRITKLLNKFFFPNLEAPPRVAKISRRSCSPMSSPLSSPVDHSPKTPSWVKTNKTHAHILNELNMPAHHTNLCTYHEGIENAGTIEEVKVEIETKVTLRQEPHNNKQRQRWKRQEAQATWRSLRQVPQMDTTHTHTHTHIYIYIYI